MIQIRKRELSKVQFIEEEVLDTPQAIKLRQKAIKASVISQAGETNKRRIAFKTLENGVLSVNSEVISFSGNYILLKGGKNIPIKSIISVG